MPKTTYTRLPLSYLLSKVTLPVVWLLLSWLGLTAVAVSADTVEKIDAKKNVVFILLDDLPTDNFGFVNPRLNTPNIDALAEQGTYFPGAAVTTSLCSPSRATILTGMTTRNHRIVDNNDSSEDHLTYFPSYLQEAGYETAFIGKWHLGRKTDNPRPGFDYWVSFKGQGTYLPKGDFGENQTQTLNVNGEDVERTTYMTDELTNYQMHWLKELRDPSKPFFLYMSHKAVHTVCRPAQRHKNQYADLTMEIPDNAHNTEKNNRNKPMWVQNQRNSWHGSDIKHPQGLETMMDEKRDCDQVLSAVDDSVGVTLQYLKETGLDKNTMVVFFSDNGYLWGQHGLTDKRNAYEESVRVPMIVSLPGLVPEGKVSDARIRNLDLAPTFLAIAGVNAPEHFDGQNTLPIITGDASWEEWDQQDFVYEYYWEWTFPATPTTFSIVRDNMKYIQYHGIWDLEELYDLDKDPNEMNNLIFDEQYENVRVDLRERLYRQLTNNRGLNTVPYTERKSRGFVYRRESGADQARFPEQWMLETTPPGKPLDFPTVYEQAVKR
ncbi:sulfatase family protein [Gilvimarinus sp. 1_MG-2023]|uniref:sulfatase family protein n=1 Tax=Gilvimarinus sp. 1_MG-2023 TaxID=3062638 RepID=UPI0026E120DF|nr:sulfatase [Gilvimarinus sp. 1_MG-2023]MDO6748356.1 sulfatase [Gilvimarinus sp. 1_MG-2023]